MTKGIRRLVMVAVVAGAGTATAAFAGGLRLPPDLVLPQDPGSMGPVTFSHASHVDSKRPDCVGCHPRLFRTLEKGRTAGGEAIKHAEMDQGRQCGACHGKGAAFALDDCSLCHR
jgi:c(7)-type cytochrome triheme protein